MNTRAAALLAGLGYSTRMSEKTADVALAQLRENPDNPRRLFGDMTDFARTIESQGMLQPIIARKAEDGHFEVVIGHRRFRAAKALGWKHAPVIVRSYTKAEALAAMLVENEAREDVSPIELAAGYQKLIDEHGLTADEVAKRVGVGRSSVYAATSLLKLPEAVQQAVLQGRLSAEAARPITSVKGERLQLAALKDALALTQPGEKMPPSRAVFRMVQQRYLSAAKKGRTKPQREAKELGEVTALRRRVVVRLLARVGELIERKAHFDETDLKLIATAHAEAGAEGAREVFQRHGVHPGRLGKVGGSQLRKLVMELALAQWVAMEGGEYSTGAKVVAKAYGLSLGEMEKTAAATLAADALFEKG